MKATRGFRGFITRATGGVISPGPGGRSAWRSSAWSGSVEPWTARATSRW
ncbi:hypothetical protein [Brachybacterium sp. GPGPB12]